jgi:hypothetical protein
MTRLRHAASLSLMLAACGPPRLRVDPQGDESSSSTSSSSTSSTTETSSTGPSDTFVPDYDQPILSTCDVFEQDCPDGDKCVAYSSTGEGWDGFKCVPVMGDRVPGEPCTYGGSAEATDDCDEHSACWNFEGVGVEQGTCLAFCMGTADDPICPPDSSCVISSSYTLGYCLPTCDPLAQDCNVGYGCYWTHTDFSCVFTTENIPEGEPCGYVNDCAPSLVCLTAEVLPACNGSACCGRWCNHDLGDAQCETAPGTVCELFFQVGMAPPGYENLGVCILPGS